MNYLLDSDFVTDWLNRQAAAVALFPRLLQDGVAMSIISHSEILEGILGGRDPKAAERVFRTFLQGVRILPVSRAVSRRHAKLRLDLRRNKRQINERALDLLIAATALTYGLTLVTSNTRDYQDISALVLLNPRTATR
jgi:tRNA(fMet)-specific endonuclease VapC